MIRLLSLGITLLVVLLGGLIAAPASADCQGGPVWPSLDRARGTTFMGVFEGVTTTNEEGDETFHWTVERVYAGPLTPGALDGWGIGKPSCHPTKYREGTRYLVSSRFPGGADAFDTVAYEVLGGGRVRIASFPMQPRSSALRIYHVDTLKEALRLLVPGRPPKASGSGPSPSFEPSTEGQAKNDLFALTIATDRTQVVADEPIAITTTLRYISTAKNKNATVSGPGGGLVAFGVEQLDGPIDTGPGWRLSCGFHRFAPGEVQEILFEKSGGFDADGPMAGFWRTWFADSILRLPEGQYVITAYAYHGGRGAVCTGPWETLTASVSLEVVAEPTPPPSLSADASAAPEADDWGPLAVVAGGGGPDATTGPGTLSISADCVTFQGDGATGADTLVWGSDRTSWRPKNQRIVFEHHQHGTTRLSDGDRVSFGGMALEQDLLEASEGLSVWLEESWVQPPDPSCPEAMWLVGEVAVLPEAPRVKLVNPDGRRSGWVATAGQKLMATRDDYAGVYLRDGLPVFLFTGDLDLASEQLLGRFGDDVSFEVREVERSLAELKATQQAITDRLGELAAAGLHIREVGTNVGANRVEVGAYRNLQGTRGALAEYGDMVHVFWSGGAYTGPQPIHGTAVKHVDDVKLRLTLDDHPLVAGRPTWITARIENGGDTPITYTTDGCENPVIVGGRMLDEQWRPYEPADVEAIRAAGQSEYLDFRWRTQEWTQAGQSTISLGIVPKRAIGLGDYGCLDLAIGHRVPPGGVVERRLRWDGDASESLGPPPEGLARITGSFDFHRRGTPGEQTVEVEFDVPVTPGRDPELLHPMEAVDAALANETFRGLIETVNLGHRAEEVILYDDKRDVWVVGACADGSKWKGNWRAAVVDPMSGEVLRVLDRVTGKYCHEGPWKDR